MPTPWTSPDTSAVKRLLSAMATMLAGARVVRLFISCMPVLRSAGCPAAAAGRPGTYWMQLRTTLILFFTAVFLGLLVVLPRTPLVLGWLWDQAGSIAAERNLELHADSIEGNAWGGVTIRGLELRGSGLDLTSREARIEYGLLSLLRGRLSLSLELEGARGTIDPQPSESLGTGSRLPLDLHHLSLSDIDISIAEYDLVLPSLRLSEVTAETTGEALRFSGRADAPRGGLAFSGVWDMQDGELTADVREADIRLVDYWWDGVDGGTFTGRVTASERGVEVDGFVRDGAVSVINTRVTDIQGPVTMKDLTVRAELAGNGLGAPIGASVTVDIPGEEYRGQLTGNPDLQEALLWLGRSTGVDLRGITAEGSLSMQTVVTGWYETAVIGTAGGSGTLAGLPLTELLGDFGYRTATGTAADVRGVLGGGQLGVRLDPDGPGHSDLTVILAGLEAAAGVTVDGNASLEFRPDGAPLTSSVSARLQAELPG